ncbi:MAG: DNA translocase FtsK, partial [Tumebacillaceae bacterium]
KPKPPKEKAAKEKKKPAAIFHDPDPAPWEADEDEFAAGGGALAVEAEPEREFTIQSFADQVMLEQRLEEQGAGEERDYGLPTFVQAQDAPQAKVQFQHEPPAPQVAVPPKKEIKLKGVPGEAAAADEPLDLMTPVETDEHYELPPMSLLDMPKGGGRNVGVNSVKSNAKKLEQTFESFGVSVKVVNAQIGPTVTQYEVQPAVGVKVSRIVNLSDDIALALAAKDIRIEAPIPGKSAVGIEVPNHEVAVVTLREVLDSPEFQNSDGKLTVALGRDISGQPIIGNLAKMPHVLVAGATGSGKSVCVNGIITSILYKAKPSEVKFIMVDPKMVELNVYNGIPHLMAPVVTDPRRAAYALKKVVAEMEHRYELFSKTGCRNMDGYNAMMVERGAQPLPYIVVIVDELADLMMVAPGDVEDAICRLAQMARAAGIHMIIATQRPSVDVITGVIKANIPSRIAFAVSSQVDSRTILDGSGAEKLLGRGDMLYLPVGASKPVRVQGNFLSDSEVERVVNAVKEQQQ